VYVPPGTIRARTGGRHWASPLHAPFDMSESQLGTMDGGDGDQTGGGSPPAPTKKNGIRRHGFMGSPTRMSVVLRFLM